MGSIQISSMSWSVPGNRGASLFSRRAHLLTTPKGRWYFLRKSCALRGGLRRLRTPLDKAAFLSNCQPCPCRRRRGFRCGSPCSWGGILPPHPAACLRQPATGSLTQMQGWNDLFHPCWWCVVFHDAPVAIEYGRRATAFHSRPSERMVDNGDLSFGGQDGQPWSRALRRGCCGLSELFPDAQRV